MAPKVIGIQQGEQTPAVGLSDFAEFDPEEVASAPIEPARVKWFDKAKGFGFANVFGSSADIFVHIEVLRMSGLADLLPGEAIAGEAVIQVLHLSIASHLRDNRCCRDTGN